jgi:hypothetical protein
MQNSRQSRRQTGRDFVSTLYWIGGVLVCTFLLWAVAMVFWQALAAFH